MWRFLLQAGMGAATLNVAGRIARLKRMAVYFAIAGVLGLLALGALLFALGALLEPRFGAAGAAAVVGGLTLVVAAFVAWAATWTPRPPRPTVAPIADRVRSELSAVGSAFSGSDRPRLPGERRTRGVNMILIAALAGIVLGRRL